MKVITKELCKQIKKSSHSLIWTLEDGINYIMNRHWAVKYEELPRDVLIALFTVFAKQPSEGKSLVANLFGDDERKVVSVKNIFEEAKSNNTKGEITKIIIDQGDHQYRVVKAPDLIIRLNNQYMAMVPADDEARCKGAILPVTFCEGQLIILPIRVAGRESENEIIESLLIAV